VEAHLVHSTALIGTSVPALKRTPPLWQALRGRAKIAPMPEGSSHPHRAAATLAELDPARAPAGGPFAPPGAGAADCRIDLKLLQWRALQAAARDPRAREHLAPWPPERHPDLWAGTVRDGVARGFMARLEEAVALAPPPAPPAPPLGAAATTAAGVRVTEGRELRKRRDVLVASGGTRVRFTRRDGVTFVDRAESVTSRNCVRFEARRDLGTLDAFVPAADERPRLYSAQFLKPLRLVEAPGVTELVLAGRLGRGPVGWPCEAVLRGALDEDTVHLRLRVDQRLRGWRLRARFLGLPRTAIAHACTDVAEVVDNDAGGFVAFTIVRAVDTLLVDGVPVAVPAAACTGSIEHEFRLG
jgi:hypothetical protein